MSLETLPPMQLSELAVVFTRLIDSSDMVSKRSCRAYVEEDDGADEGLVRQGKKGSSCDEPLSVGMERQISAPSSDRTSVDELTTTSLVETGGVDLGRDLAGLLQPQGWNSSSQLSC